VLTLVGVVGFAQTGAGGGPSTLLALGPVNGLALSQVGWGVDPRLAVVVTAATVGTTALLGGVSVVTARVADASHPERAR
jgi:hypothetical protein